MSKNVVVIGAGPGGLASAMLLASAGFKVTVIERQNYVGGRTSVFDVDGFKFDRGPTFFLYPEALESIFRMCGRNLRDEVDLIRLDPSYRLVFEAGGQIDAANDPEALKREVAKLSPSDAQGFDRYMRENRRKFAAFRPVLETAFSRHSDLLKLPIAKLLPLLRPWRSVDSDLGRFFEDPRVRLAFSFQSKYLGMSPFKCPSLFTILGFLEHEYGVYHPRGGCGAVSEAMGRVAWEMGVDIVLGESVEEVLFEGRRAVGVRTQNAKYECDALVINGDFASTMQALVPDRLRRRWNDRRLAKKKYSCSTFMLYLGIEGLYDNLAHHTVFLADGYEEHIRDIETRHELTVNPSFYIQNPGVTDSTFASRDSSSLYVLVPVTHMHENVDWPAVTPAFRNQVLNQLANVGLGDIRNRIKSERIFTPRDWAREMHLYRGATFSLAHSLDQMLSLRPRNRFEDLESVYLVGGGTHPGSGLPVIFESAKISTSLLAADFGIANAWQPPPRPTRAWPRLLSDSAYS